MIRWVLATTVEHSIASRAKSVSVPALQNGEIEKGAADFETMCRQCHGAPSRRAGEIGRGLRPESPDLSKASGHWSPAELFWIVKNGIKMTGVPAFGKSHSDTDLWNIVAFVNRLPDLSAEQYESLVRSIPSGHNAGGGNAHSSPEKHH